MLYLAAAVSDFYVPQEEMPEHKIQSNISPKISLQLVPKILKPLVSSWVTKGYVVSFKLETDESLLIPKSRDALAKYDHKLVIANMLESRRKQVVLVTPTTVDEINLTNEQVRSGLEIERLIVEEICIRHEEYQEEYQ